MTKNVIRGTVAELVAKGLTVNGMKMDQTGMSFLTRLGLAREAGTVPKKEGRGKAATIWEVDVIINVNMTAAVAEASQEAVTA